jgi:catechol 2,3-dioxygenase-like lactoylglutathione lyase family enzyme
MLPTEDEMITPSSSFPVFIVADLDAAQRFYTANLGFTPLFANDWYLHLATESGVQVGFMLPDQPTQPPMFHNAHNGSGVIFSLEVENADDAYDQATRAGLDIVLSLRSEEWGQRHFCLRDPNGLFIDIAQAIAPNAEYEQGYQG